MTKFICVNLTTETILMKPYYEIDEIRENFRIDSFELYLNGEAVFSCAQSLLDSTEVFDTEEEALGFTDTED